MTSTLNQSRTNESVCGTKPVDLFFPRGLYGFESHHYFVHTPSGNGVFYGLSSVDNAKLRFLTLWAGALPNFAYSDDDRLSIANRFDRAQGLDFFCILTLRSQDGIVRITANTRAPIVVAHNGWAHQWVMDNGDYLNALPVDPSCL